MAAGRKMPVDLLVIYSEAYLGKKGGVDVAGVWREWADGEVSVEAVGGGVGHFLAEEAPEEVVRHLMDWMRDHGLLNGKILTEREMPHFLVYPPSHMFSFFVFCFFPCRRTPFSHY